MEEGVVELRQSELLAAGVVVQHLVRTSVHWFRQRRNIAALNRRAHKDRWTTSPCSTSSLTRQCVTGRRFGDVDPLRAEASAWSTDANDTQRRVDWQMKIDDARCKLKSVYPKINL
jgi:hypothetical protein